MPRPITQSAALFVTLFLLFSPAVSATNEHASSSLEEIFPFRLGMNCGDVEELLQKTRKGRIEGLEYYAKQFKSETNSLYTCINQPMRFGGGEVPRYGFDMSINGSDPNNKYSRGNHSIYFDRAGTAIAITMERTWSPNEPTPSIAAIRKSLEAKYGKPAIYFGYPPNPNGEEGGFTLIWGGKVNSSTRSDERTKEIGTKEQWAKELAGCYTSIPKTIANLNPDCAVATIKMLSRAVDVAKQPFDDVRVEADVNISRESSGNFVSMRIEAANVKAFSKYRIEERKDSAERLQRFQQKTIPRF